MYKVSHQLAPEALDALDHFLPALNEFFNLCNESTEKTMENIEAIVDWYNSAISSSRDTIRAMSKYYNHTQFDNVSINMDIEEEDEYNTDNGACFAKVLFDLHCFEYINININYFLFLGFNALFNKNFGVGKPI